MGSDSDALNKKEPFVCRCEEVTEREICQAIADGAFNVNGVKRRTRAGMGLCQGRTCRRQVQGIIARETGRPLAEIVPPTARAPVRPLPFAWVAREDDGHE